ncbi:unnamed protein product [Camellia sinensis]
MENRRIRSRGIEVNTMAILDASGFVKATQDLSDDRITFLEAVRSASLVPDNGIAPTYKMFEAIFQILKEENSLELIMSSYQLLNELDKRYPRVYTSKVELSKLPSPSNAPELVVVEEAWSPFTFASDSERDGANKNSGESFDSTSFHLLIQDLVKVVVQTKSEELETKSLRNMLLLQYLTSVLEGDFVPRYSICKDIMNWNLLRESLLNMLLGSRRISYKGLIKDCVSIMCEMSHVHTEISHDIRLPENSAVEQLKDCDAAVAISFPEVKKCTCIALQKLLLMAMELDTSKKKADILGLTTRADGLRTPAVEIIQDELTYNRDALFPFFQVFNEPKWKLELIIQYFQKYIAKAVTYNSAFMQPFAEGFLSSPLLPSRKAHLPLTHYIKRGKPCFPFIYIYTTWKLSEKLGLNTSITLRVCLFRGHGAVLHVIPSRWLDSFQAPSTRTRQSSDPIDDATYDGILKSFSNSNCAKNIIKKISAEVAQLLLAHAFQAVETCEADRSAFDMPLLLFVALVGATVGGLLARHRRGELERLNEQLRQINAALRRQAKIESYAPTLSYAPVSGRIQENEAYLSLSSQHSAEGICQSKEDVRESSLVEICKNIISAFTNLRRIDENMEILPFGKEALFTAATILSTKS